jgi:hypothetical protein
MEVFDIIYHQFFFTANSLGRQPTTSQFCRPLAPQMLALVPAAIHCALSEYATGKMITVMFSQDEYRGKFCPSTVMNCITAEATALINYTWWGCFIPPLWFSSAIIGAPQSPSALLRYHRRSSIPIGASQSGLALRNFIQRSMLHFCWRSCSRMDASRPRSGVPLFHSLPYPSLPFGDAQHRWAAPLDRCSFAWILTPQFHSALLHRHHHSPCPPCTPHHALLSWWRTSFPHEFIILPFKLHFDSPRANLSIPTL